VGGKAEKLTHLPGIESLVPHAAGLLHQMPGVVQKARHLAGGLAFAAVLAAIGKAGHVGIAQAFEHHRHQTGIVAAAEGNQHRPAAQGIDETPEDPLVHPVQRPEGKVCLRIDPGVAEVFPDLQALRGLVPDQAFTRLELAQSLHQGVAKCAVAGDEKLAQGFVIQAGIAEAGAQGKGVGIQQELPVAHRVEEGMGAHAVNRRQDVVAAPRRQAEHAVNAL